MARLDPKLTGFGDFRIVEENLCATAEAINGDTPRGDIWAIVGTRPRARALA